MIKKVKNNNKKVAVIYYPQFGVEASKAPGGSGSAQSHLGFGGRIETGTQGDLITLWCIEVTAKTGLVGASHLCEVHFT